MRRAFSSLAVNATRSERRFAVSGGTEFNLIGADVYGRFDLRWIGIYKQAREYVCFPDAIYRRSHRDDVCFRVESAFGGDLVRSFGHERDGVRRGLQRDVQHLVSRGHLEIQVSRD